MWLIDNSTVIINNDNIHVYWREIGTAGHNALLVFTHNYDTRVSFPWLQCTCQPIIISWVLALQLVAWALLGNHSSTITIACGYSKSTVGLGLGLQKSCNKELIVQNHSWTIYTSFLHDFIGDNYIAVLCNSLSCCKTFAICCTITAVIRTLVYGANTLCV